MELKPGYKQTEVGVIPEDWRITQIKEFAEIATGNRNTQDRVADGEYPFFVRSQVIERIDSYSFDGEAVLTAGDGVGTGKVFHHINGRFDVHQRVYRISHFAPDVNGFLFFLIFSNRFYDRIMSMTAKSSVDSVRMEMIANMKIALPGEVAEQRAIVAALRDVDALLEALTKLIAKKGDLKRAAMQQLLTGRTRLPGFHRMWELRGFGEVFQFLRTANNPRADLSGSGDVGYLHYGDIHTSAGAFLDCATKPIPRISKAKVESVPTVEDGDLVMVDASEDNEGLGKSVEIRNVEGRQIVAGLHTFLLRGDCTVLADGFKGYLQFLPSVKDALIRLATGISVFGVSKRNVMGIEVQLPPPEEQTAIATVLSDMDAELSALEARLTKTRALKAGMMQDLLTGRIRLVGPGQAP